MPRRSADAISLWCGRIFREPRQQDSSRADAAVPQILTAEWSRAGLRCRAAGFDYFDRRIGNSTEFKRS